MTDTLSVQEYRKMAKPKKGKYRNEKIEYKGKKFDSKRELYRYQTLDILECAGNISNLERQVKFILVPAQYEDVNGKRKCIAKACSYYADFVYNDINGNRIVEDVKGVRTQIYILKKKLMLQLYSITIKEI